MSINVIAQLKAADDLRRRKGRIKMKSKMKASIVGGYSRSMKDTEKAQYVHPFSLLHLFPLLASSERRACLCFRGEKRGLVVSIVHFIG